MTNGLINDCANHVTLTTKFQHMDCGWTRLKTFQNKSIFHLHTPNLSHANSTMFNAFVSTLQYMPLQKFVKGANASQQSTPPREMTCDVFMWSQLVKVCQCACAHSYNHIVTVNTRKLREINCRRGWLGMRSRETLYQYARLSLVGRRRRLSARLLNTTINPYTSIYIYSKMHKYTSNKTHSLGRIRLVCEYKLVISIKLLVFAVRAQSWMECGICRFHTYPTLAGWVY